MKTDREGKSGFKCFYKDKTCEVWADSSYQAQKLSGEIFKLKKHLYKITVVLCQRSDGTQVIHSTAGI